MRKIFGWEDCKVVVSARALEASHGAMDFVRAMTCIVNQQPDIRVLMLGDGSLMPEVRGYVQSRGIAEKFHLAGQVPEDLVPDYFAEADLYVSAAPCDGSSISLLQAMGCGLPVVVADAGGNREWVKHETNGWLYLPANIGALVAATGKALDSSELWPQMGRTNVNIVKARANWDENSQQLLCAYETLLHHKHAKEKHSDAELQNR
ncbi:MAG TPA: glycosyltransferase [Candidatus Acidoferrales bacterium]|nr:glycosyltransferase [Candidatus Acidoferrales bacterium]